MHYVSAAWRLTRCSKQNTNEALNFFEGTLNGFNGLGICILVSTQNQLTQLNSSAVQLLNCRSTREQETSEEDAPRGQKKPSIKQCSSNVQALYYPETEMEKHLQANQNQKRCKTANDFETFDIRPSSDHHIFLKTFSELKAPRPVTLGALLLPQGQTSPQTSVSRVRVTEISRVWVESPSTTSMAFSARESFYAHLSAFLVMWDGVKCVEIKSDPDQKTCSKGIIECLCQETTETARAGHLTAQWRLPGPPAHRGTYMPRVGGERESERERVQTKRFTINWSLM